MYFAGIDVGSATTKVMVIDAERNELGHAILPSGGRLAQAAENALAKALESAGLTADDLAAIVSTGYGRESVENRTKSVTEITCHARGVSAHYPEARLVIDIGGQDSKAISLADNGTVRDFVMNDKCAAGTGRFLEVMSRTLEVGLEEMGQASIEADGSAKIPSTCTVFAESEVVSLLAQGETLPRIFAGICTSVSERVKSLAARVGIQPEVVMTGGVAKNIGVVKSMERALGLEITVPKEPQITGALGAALIACATCADKAKR